MKTIGEEIKSDVAIDAVDIDTADVESGTFYSMADFDRVRAVARATADMTAGKIISVQLKQATAADGTGSKNLGSAVTVAAASGALQPQAEVEATADEMDNENSFTFVGVEIGVDEGSAIDGCAVLLRAGARYEPAN